VAFHVKINEDFYGLEAGQIARDIVKVRNGRWTYQDRQTQLNRDDIIYYWIHVVYRGLGYNTVDKSYPVTGKLCLIIKLKLNQFSVFSKFHFLKQKIN